MDAPTVQTGDDIADRVGLVVAALLKLPPGERDAALARAVDEFEKITHHEQPTPPADAIAAECLRFAGGVIERLNEDDDPPFGG